MEKAELRKQQRKIRSSLTVSRIMLYSGCITERLTKEPAYQEAELVLSYMSFSSEVSTHFILENAWEAGKRVAVPKCGKNGTMVFHEIGSFEEVREGMYGIMEPEKEQPVVLDKGTKAVLLLPCVAFDENGNRLGYGGGYYDRFMEAHPYIPKILLAYELQRVPEVPKEPWDIPADVMITEIERYQPSIQEDNT